MTRKSEAERSARAEASRCTVRILSDDPAAVDVLGAHQRIADGIAEIVTRQEGGKAISLRGSLGSGKSTVVELLRNSISAAPKSEEVGIFVYDAWAHQGDPLRRAFLEQIYRFLTESKWVAATLFEERFDALRNRTEKVQTESTPKLTPFGGVVAVAVFLVPLGIALLRGTNFLRPLRCQWQFWLGLVLSLLPLLLVLPAWVYRRPTGAFWRSRFWTTNRAPYQDRSVIGLLWNKTDVVVRSTAIRTPDPTSIEFQELFGSLLTDALSGKRKRKLVIVVDNLDRLRPEESIQIWATMRTFFEIDGKRAAWSKSLWLLVPFAPAGIRRLWTEAKGNPVSGNDSTQKNTQDKEPTAAAMRENIDETATTFLRKTFQVSFDLPEPVLSEWTTFFLKQISIVLPQHTEEEWQAVHLLYRHRCDATGVPVTPRDIKLFLNDLAAVHQQWADEIPLRTQVAWVLYGKEINLRALTSGGGLDTATQLLLEDPKWPENFVALHFNIRADLATQVLHEPLVRRALEEGNAEALERLQTRPEFAHICELVISREYENWARLAPNALALASSVVGSLEWMPSPTVTAIWKYLRQGVNKVERWRPLTEKVAHGLVRFVQNSENQQDQSLTEAHVVGTLSRSSAEVLQSGGSDTRVSVTPEEWGRAAVHVLAEIKRRGGTQTIAKNFSVPPPGVPPPSGPGPGPPLNAIEFYWQALAAVAELADKDRGYTNVVEDFVPSTARDEIVDQIFRDSNDQKLAGHLVTIRNMLRVRDAWPWQLLVNGFLQRLTNVNQPPPNSDVFFEILLLLGFVASQHEAQEALQSLTSGGYTLHYLNTTRSAPAATARLLLVALLFWTEGSPKGTGPGQAAQGWQFYDEMLGSPSDAIIDELVPLAGRLKRFDELVRGSVSTPARRNLAHALFRRAAERGDFQSYFSPSFVIEHHGPISEALQPDRLKRIFETLTSATDFLQQVLKLGFAPARARLFLLCLDTPTGRATTGFHRYLLDGLNRTDRATWDAEMSNEGELIQLVLLLHDTEQQANFGQDFQDALLSHAEGLFAGKSAPSKFGDKWASLLGFLSDQARMVLLADLRDQMLQAAKPLTPLLKLYGVVLAHAPNVWADRADEVVRHLFRDILDRRQPDELEWIVRLLQNNQQFATFCRDESRADFVQRLDRVLQDEKTSKDTKELVIQIKKFFEA